MRKIHLLNVAAYVLMVTVNFLAVSLPLAGNSTKELSDKYPNLFVPAGFTFSVWGIIYLLLGIYAFYALFVSGSSVVKNPLIDKIAAGFLLTCIFNSAWIFAWHYELLWLSVLIMLGLLLSLIWIYRLLDTGYLKKQTLSELIVRVPFSVYLGWISVATVANITAFMVGSGFDGGSLAPYIASVMIAVAFILGLLMIIRQNDVFYTLVIAWALFGIYSERAAENTQSATVVANVAVAFSILSVIIVVFGFFRFGKKVELLK